MPWKNGGGETVEIAVSPDRATIADFDWRISMATVATNGSFSTFPGVDRTLSILEGGGMTLSIEGRQPKLLTASDAPLSFPADVPTSAALSDGPVTDLNVMTRRQALNIACAEFMSRARIRLPRTPATLFFSATVAALRS